MTARLDHLVIAAASLEEGRAWVLRRLGVDVPPGGRHPRMGTVNAVLRISALDDPVYLEVIAIDPEAPPPDRPRWFGLDDFAGPPRLVHWVARSDGLEADVARATHPPGTIHPMTRGALSWRITIPDDGHLPGEGLLPTLIQWPGGQPHPATHMVDGGGVRLLGLELQAPDPGGLRAALNAIPVNLAHGPVSVLEAAGPVRLIARLRTPGGVVSLSG